MKVTLTVNQVLDSIQQIKNLQNQVHPTKFNYALVQIIKVLKDTNNAIAKTFSNIEKKRTALCVEYCEKDEKGKPVIEGEKYKGLERGVNADFDKKFSALEKERDEYLKKELEIDAYSISESLVPERLNGLQYEAILPFIVAEKEYPFKEDKK